MARRSSAVTGATVSELASALPGVREGTSYGTPAWRVRGKLLARMKEDGETLVLKVGFDERETLLEAAPRIYFTTDHYRNSPYVLVRLSRLRTGALAERLEESWRPLASRRQRAELETRG